MTRTTKAPTSHRKFRSAVDAWRVVAELNATANTQYFAFQVKHDDATWYVVARNSNEARAYACNILALTVEKLTRPAALPAPAASAEPDPLDWVLGLDDETTNRLRRATPEGRRKLVDAKRAEAFEEYYRDE